MEKLWGINECLLVARGETLQDTFRSMAERTTELLSRVLRNGDTVGVGESMGPLGRADIDVVFSIERYLLKRGNWAAYVLRIFRFSMRGARNWKCPCLTELPIYLSVSFGKFPRLLSSPREITRPSRFGRLYGLESLRPSSPIVNALDRFRHSRRSFSSRRERTVYESTSV